MQCCSASTRSRPRSEAALLRGVYLCVDVDAARPLADGEWFVWQLVGLRVLDTTGTDVGVVDDVEAGVGNDVLVIRDEHHRAPAADGARLRDGRRRRRQARSR